MIINVVSFVICALLCGFMRLQFRKQRDKGIEVTEESAIANKVYYTLAFLAGVIQFSLYLIVIDKAAEYHESGFDWLFNNFMLFSFTFYVFFYVVHYLFDYLAIKRNGSEGRKYQELELKVPFFKFDIAIREKVFAYSVPRKISSILLIAIYFAILFLVF